MLVCRSRGRQAEPRRAHAAARLREHRVEADRAQQRALPGHVRAGDEQQRPGRSDLDVVGDPSLRRDQRVAQGLRGDDRRRVDRRRARRRLDHGRAPTRVVAAGGRQRRQRIQLADRLQPRAHPRAGRTAPPVEREQHVKIPQRERLNRKVQDRRAAAERREPENPIQLPHAGRRRDAVRGQPVVQVAQRRRLEARGRGVLEQPGISRQRVLPRARTIERGVSPLRHRERQDEAEHQRNQPDGRVDDAGENSARRIQIDAVSV